MKSLLKGTLTALVTPFRDGRVDEENLRALVDRQIAGGVSGLVPCGTTGESVSLSLDEHAKVIRTVVEETRGRVPVVAGGGTASTQKSIELSRAAKQSGADALLLVCPYYNRPTQRGLEAHFRAVLNEVPLPTVLYNIPSRTGVDLLPETIGKLLDITEIVAIKEATGDVERSRLLLQKFAERLIVLSGEDSLTVELMKLGARGVVSVTANVAPREVAKVTSLMLEGNASEAELLHAKLLPLHRAMFIETNPGPIKYAVSCIDGIAAEIRLPLVWPAPETQQQIMRALSQVGISPQAKGVNASARQAGATS